ncbi:hypothetical protein NW759_012836 [Fusarium solani]|nr:hypothetical protein NW759_012836 [Fusarium solani]
MSLILISWLPLDVHVHVREEHGTRNDSLTNNDETIYRVPASRIYQTIQCLLLNSRPTWNASLIHSPCPCQLVPSLIGCTRLAKPHPLFLLFPASITQNKPRPGFTYFQVLTDNFVDKINARKRSLMPPRRRQRPLPRVYALLNAGVRLVAWLTSLAAVLMLAYVGKEWPSKSQVVVAGALGCAIAMLNDSWDMLATTDASMVVPRLAASRRVLHDLFSMALCVGGIIMMWVSNISLSPEKTSEQRRQEMWIMMALWTLIAVVYVSSLF